VNELRSIGILSFIEVAWEPYFLFEAKKLKLKVKELNYQ